MTQLERGTRILLPHIPTTFLNWNSHRLVCGFCIGILLSGLPCLLYIHIIYVKLLVGLEFFFTLCIAVTKIFQIKTIR